ncbi:unnamed protein product [Urochloa humidicola]
MTEKLKVRLDFHIFDILNLDLLLGCPVEELLDKSQGSLDERLREVTFATTTSWLKNPMARPLPKATLFESVMYVSLFISSEPVLFKVAFSTLKEYDSEETLHLCEDKRSSSPSTMFESLPASPNYVVFDHDPKATSSFHDESLEMDNSRAMEDFEVLTQESDTKDSTVEHGIFPLEIPQGPCSFTTFPE